VWPPLVAALAAILLVLGLLRITRAADQRREWIPVLGWILAAFLVQGLLRPISPYPLGDIFANDAANAFYGVAQRFDLSNILSQSRRLREQMPLHAQSNMHGKPLLTLGLLTMSSEPEALAWIVVALSNLGGILMYLFARDLFRDRRIALFALILYLFVPARIFFLPLMNTLTPVVILGCAVLLIRWLTTGKAIYAALFGASLYGLVFFEPLAPVCGADRPRDLAWRDLVRAPDLAGAAGRARLRRPRRGRLSHDRLRPRDRISQGWRPCGGVQCRAEPAVRALGP
jgi:hypothetical protein